MRTKAGTIIYFGPFQLPDKNAAAHRVVANAKCLSKLKYRVILAGYSNNNKSKISNYEYEGIECLDIPRFKTLLGAIEYTFGISVYINIMNLYENVRKIILYNFPSIPMLRLSQYCAKHNIECIADVTEWYGFSYKSIIRKADTWFRMHYVNKKLDAIIAISSYLANYYSKYTKVILIPPLTDLRSEKWHNTAKKSSTQLNLVYAGSPGSGWKDRLNVVIKALKTLDRKYSLDVIGMTIEEYLTNNYEDRCFLINNDNITFHGRVTHIEALDFVKRANYACFFREKSRANEAGFPTKFAEAITAGTRVITNDISDVKDYIFNGENGYILDGMDVSALIKVLEMAPLDCSTIRDTFHFENYTSEFKKLC